MTVIDKGTPAAARGTETALAVPAALSSPPSPLMLLKALRRHALLAVCLGTILAATAAVGTYFIMPPPKTTARTLISVPVSAPYFIPTGEQRVGLNEHQRNQMARVRSRNVLKEAMKVPGLQELQIFQSRIDKIEPVEWLEQELVADFTVAPEILRISLSGDSPSELIKVVNAIREAYVTTVLDREKRDRAARLELVTASHKKYEDRLKSVREEQRDLELAGATKTNGERAMIVAFLQQQLTWAEKELLTVRSELRKAKAEVAANEALLKLDEKSLPIPTAVLEDQFNKEPAVQIARGTLQALQVHLDETLRVAAEPKDRNPAVVRLRGQIAEGEQGLTALRKKLTPGLTVELRRLARQEAERSLAQAKGRISSFEEEEKLAKKTVDDFRADMEAGREKSAKLEVVRQSIDHVETVARRLAAEEEALHVELDAPVRYELVEEAVIIRPPESKKALMTAGMAGAAAFAAVLLSFSLWEFRTRRVGTPDEVSLGLGVPMVGVIPDAKAWASKSKTGGRTGQAILTEAVETTRTMLVRAAQIEAMRVVLITSAQAGEGKTSLSTHLATSLAQVGYPTLLIDGDLRSPVAHKVFDLERDPGLCDLLRGQVQLDEIVQPTAIDGLSMITAGRWDAEATRALARDGARQMIEAVRNRFDFVIIDSSPVLPVVDPLLFGQHADGAIISVLSGTSRMPNVYAAFQRLTAGGVRVLGAIMNGVRSEQYGTYYPYAQATEAESQA
ncbi:MAG: polysaccharide biosynthesis tyrosine autokinase [Gemmataceae bacterium]